VAEAGGDQVQEALLIEWICARLDHPKHREHGAIGHCYCGAMAYTMTVGVGMFPHQTRHLYGKPETAERI
jgi:hypothetical protein